MTTARVIGTEGWDVSDPVEIALIVAAAPTFMALAAFVTSLVNFYRGIRIEKGTEAVHKIVNAQRTEMMEKIAALEGVVRELKGDKS